jgi:glucose-6-phosphate isomerase
LGELLDILDLRRTLFNVVTKSGSTAETLSQFLVAKKALIRAVGERGARDRIVVTTDAKQGPLRRIADREGLRAFTVPDGVGGRFTVFTPVGLLSAAFGGIDLAELLAGAAAMTRCAFRDDVLKSPAYLNGLIHYLLDVKKGKTLSVVMPYSNHLARIADWYRQLWAESLGKRYSLSRREVFAGQTPVNALGATDQHSQLQLYMEGPFDKVFTFLRVEKFRRDVKIPNLYPREEALNYLGGRTMGQLIDAELLGTEYALKEARRPSVRITLPEIRPHSVGQLLMMYEIQTVFAGGLYGVDPLDQPGVEASKVATCTLMGRKEYVNRAVALRAGMRKDRRFVL